MSADIEDIDCNIKKFESMLENWGKSIANKQLPEAFLNPRPKRGRPAFITVPQKTIFARINEELHNKLFDFLGRHRMDYKVWLIRKIEEL